MKAISKWVIILNLTMAGHFVHAQSDADIEELNIIELEIEKNQQKVTTRPETRAATPAEQAKSAEYSGLSQLSPFSEVSVIQKRYLPKTMRTQIFGGWSFITNDPFFNTTGFSLKAGFFFTESWGLEANYFSLGTSDREATKDLREIQNVKTDGLVYPKSFTGVDLVWVPIYGKMTYFNRTIIPFDLYFSAGYGTTKTHAEENPGTMHLATGQIFAMSKSFALRWDFSWNFYSAKGIDNKTAQFNNLFMTVGASFFIPEAKYR